MSGYKDPKLSAATILALKPAIDWCIEQREEFGTWPKFAAIGHRFEISRTLARHAVYLADRQRDGFDIYPHERPEGVVFFVYSPTQNALKIAFSAEAHLKKRLNAMQDGNPATLSILATVPGSYQLRQQLRQQFSNQKLPHGWFRYQEPLISYVASIKP